MAVYKINPLDDLRWPEFLQRHPSASIFHTSAWLEALRRTYGYEPVVYTTSGPRQELNNGIVFCQVRSWLTGQRLVSLPFSDHCQPLLNGRDHLEEIMAALAHDHEKENWKYIELRPVEFAAQAVAAHLPICRSEEFCFHELDLRPGLERIFSRFHEANVKRALKRAERERVTYEEGASTAHLGKFYALFLMTRRKHQIPPPPLIWFRNLLACLGQGIKIRIASHDNVPIAGIITLSYKNTFYYKYGGMNRHSRNLGGNPFLMWHTIRDAKSQNAWKLDWGRSDLDNPGLIEFKDRWGTTRTTLTYYRHPGSDRQGDNASGKSWKMAIAKGVFSRLPDKILIQAGNLLYKHMA